MEYIKCISLAIRYEHIEKRAINGLIFNRNVLDSRWYITTLSDIKHSEFMKLNEVLFIILLLFSILVIGFLLSMPINLLLEGKYNAKTLIQMGIFIPATIIAYNHLYSVFKEDRMITKRMFIKVLGYIILFPVAFAIVVMFAAVLL